MTIDHDLDLKSTSITPTKLTLAFLEMNLFNTLFSGVQRSPLHLAAKGRAALRIVLLSDTATFRLPASLRSTSSAHYALRNIPLCVRRSHAFLITSPATSVRLKLPFRISRSSLDSVTTLSVTAHLTVQFDRVHEHSRWYVLTLHHIVLQSCPACLPLSLYSQQQLAKLDRRQMVANSGRTVNLRVV